MPPQQLEILLTASLLESSVHTGFFDVANAFPSPHHDALDCAIFAKHSLPDACLLQQRYQKAIRHVAGAEGDGVIPAVGCGSMQGDAIAPEHFVELYNPAISSWHTRTSRPDHRKYLTAVDPISEEVVSVDISCAYADDISRTCVANELHELQQTESRWEAALDAALRTVGMGQNRGKMEWLV